MTTVIDIWPTDMLFANNPDAGDPACLCSRCLRRISEGETPVRVFVFDEQEIATGEYRYHPICLPPAAPAAAGPSAESTPPGPFEQLMKPTKAVRRSVSKPAPAPRAKRQSKAKRPTGPRAPRPVSRALTCRFNSKAEAEMVKHRTTPLGRGRVLLALAEGGQVIPPAKGTE